MTVITPIGQYMLYIIRPLISNVLCGNIILQTKLILLDNEYSKNGEYFSFLTIHVFDLFKNFVFNFFYVDTCCKLYV